jgi:hypothetical protein
MTVNTIDLTDFDEGVPQPGASALCWSCGVVAPCGRVMRLTADNRITDVVITATLPTCENCSGEPSVFQNVATNLARHLLDRDRLVTRH